MPFEAGCADRPLPFPPAPVKCVLRQQVAAQQGSYAAHMINKGYVIGRGGQDALPPARPANRILQSLSLFKSKETVAADEESYEGLAARMAETDADLEFFSRPFGEKQDRLTPLLAYSSTVLPAFKTPMSFLPHVCSLLPPLSPCSPGSPPLLRCPLLAPQPLTAAPPHAEFMSLGIMAYVGDSKAAIDTQKSVGKNTLGLYGGFAFLLWRSVYITKQVSFRNRVLILFDWLKTRVFGRDLSMF